MGQIQSAPEPPCDWLLQEIFAQSPDWITWHDLEGRYREVSPICQSLLGYTPAELLGRSPYEFFHAEDRAAIEHIHRLALEEHHTWMIRYRFRKKEGEYLWLESKGHWVQPAGQEPGLLCFSRDVSPQATFQQQLKTEHQQYQVLIEAMNKGVVRLDLGGKIVFSNRRAEEILGLPAEQMHERTLFDPRWRTITPQGQPFSEEEHPVKRTLRTGTAQSQVLIGLETPAGQRRWLQINTAPLSEGQPAQLNGVVASFSEMTPQFAQQQQIQVAREKYQKLFEHERDAVLVYDAEQGFYEEANPAAQELYGYSVEEFLHLNPLDLSAEPEATRLKLQQAHHADLGRFVRHQRKKNGEVFIAEISTGRFWIEGKLKIIGAVRDVTEAIQTRQKLEETLEDLLKTQEHLIQNAQLTLLGRLAAGMAHEINQPLQVIVLEAEMTRMLLNAEESARIRKSLANIQTQVQKITQIIQHLRIFAHPDPAKPPESVRLNQILENALTFFRQQFALHGVALHLELAAGLPEVKGQPLEIEQVLINLLSNARDALAESPLRRLTVRTSEHQAGVRLEIEDTGCGIPEADLPKLFEPFFTTKPLGLGIGMGLTLSQKIVQKHGGRLEAKRLGETGACFTLWLPLPAESN